MRVPVQRQVGRVGFEGRGIDGVPRPPVIVHEASPGPVIVITANVHGDEVSGTFAIHELDRLLSSMLTLGSVALYPTLNPSGLQARTRGVGSDQTDLNRSFPGDAYGNTAERLAAALWKDICGRRPMALVDLHADSAHSIPYAIVDRPVGLSGGERAGMVRSLDAAGASTGITVLRDYPSDQYRRYALDRSLAGAMVNRAKTIAVTIESGPRRNADADAVDAHVQAVLGLLAHWGMVTRPLKLHPTRVPGSWRRATHLKARAEGLFVPTTPVGTRFALGAKLGEIRGLAGDVIDQVIASEPGVVIAYPDAAWTLAGGSIGTFGVYDEESP